MPIDTICQTCARKLRVADQYAGKKARCPQCGTIYVVPGEPAAAVPSGLAETIYKPQPAPAVTAWQVRTPDGRVYGPVPKTELDQWVAEGRIPSEAMVQSDISPTWRPAGELYPQLQRTGPLQAATNPFVDQPFVSPFQATSAGPFQNASAVAYREPHRGVLILIFGILGYLGCAVLAPVAWFMGHVDLRKMRRGMMDDSGMGLTQTGMVLGMICTIIGILFMTLLCAGVIG